MRFLNSRSPAHTAFHKSVLHAGGDEPWGDPFCDAFRYFAEREYVPGPPSGFVARILGESSLGFEEVMARSKDSAQDATYGYPASLIVRCAGGSLAGLRQLWLSLLELRLRKGSDVLDDYFGYSVRARKPLEGGARCGR